MKKTLYTLVICLIIVLQPASSQALLRNTIDSLMRLYYPNANFKIPSLYIVDGMPIDSNQLDSLIINCGYDIVKYSLLEQSKFPTTWERQTNIVLLGTNSSWTDREKIKDFRNAKKKLKRTISDIDNCPVLIINSNQIEFQIAYHTIKSISIKQIHSINLFEDSVSIDKYGIKGKNGLIDIKIVK
jgi:hypothetical protein